LKEIEDTNPEVIQEKQKMNILEDGIE